MNFFDGMRAFTRVVEAGGLAAADLDLGLARSVIHKHVLKLEHTLGILQLGRRSLATSWCATPMCMWSWPSTHRFVDLIEEGFDISIPINCAPCSRRKLRRHCR